MVKERQGLCNFIQHMVSSKYITIVKTVNGLGQSIYDVIKISHCVLVKMKHALLNIGILYYWQHINLAISSAFVTKHESKGLLILRSLLYYTVHIVIMIQLFSLLKYNQHYSGIIH